jgi:Xaa-Pro aminopeptidase
VTPVTPPEHFAGRRQRLAAGLAAEGLDALLVGQPVNVSYLTGFSGESSNLLVTPNRSVLVSDGRFTQQLAEECPDLETVIRPPVTPVTEATAQTLAKLGAKNVGFESAHVTVADLEALRGGATGIDWKGTRDRVEQWRACKDTTEVAQIRAAIDMAQRAYAMFRALLRADDSEKDLSDAVEAYIRRAGGRGSSFPAIVAVGDRAALPHAPPTDRKVAANPLLLLDWGASGPFYKSDLTRVLWTRTTSSRRQPRNGNGVDPKFQEIYGVVLRAQAAAIAALRPGVTAGAVDAAARSVIAAAGYADYFTHSTGHGIGLQVHEAPLLRPTSEAVLQAGMVVTIEPGIYLPDWGGVRIEDDVLLTADGHEVLTSVPKDLGGAVIEC